MLALGDFKDLLAPQIKEQIVEQYEIPSLLLEGIHLIVAGMWEDSYDAHAFIVFEREGKVFEVQSAHCSCYGHEGQWEPIERPIEAIVKSADYVLAGNDIEAEVVRAYLLNWAARQQVVAKKSSKA